MQKCVVIGKHLAFADRVLADRHVVAVHAVQRGRRVVGAVDRLTAAADRGRAGADVRCLALDRPVVLQLERLHAAGALPHSAEAAVAGVYHDHVRAHFRDLLADAPLRSLADGQHRDDRSDADDDAQHRQEPSELVVGKGFQCDFYQILVVHLLGRLHAVVHRNRVEYRLGRLDVPVTDVVGNVPVAQHDIPAAELRDLRVVRDEYDRAPLGVQTLEQRQNLERGPRIEVAGRFVGQNHHRIVNERPRDRHALLLSAGHLVRAVVDAVRQSYLFQGFGRPFAPLAGRYVRIVEQREFDVLERRGFGQQIVRLEHESDFAVAERRAVVAPHLADRDAVEPVFARGRRVEAAQNVQQRRFSRAARAHDRHELALRDRERYAPQRVNRLAADLKVPAQILDSYDMIVHGFALIRFRGSETFVCPAAGPPV